MPLRTGSVGAIRASRKPSPFRGHSDASRARGTEPFGLHGERASGPMVSPWHLRGAEDLAFF